MPTAPHSIEILGGGLAGLTAGILLRREGINVTLHEAARYPRHRVCGEFLAGLDREWIENHGLGKAFHGACVHRSCAWFGDDPRPFFRASLPGEVLGISRHRLDTRLAEIFTALGGRLCEQSRPAAEAAAGRVIACGRPSQGPVRWVGMKAHFRDIALSADLEVHLGRGGYLGLTRVEDGAVNACGLFPANTVKSSAGGESRMVAAVRGLGLGEVARRLECSEMVAGSLVGCARFGLGWQKPVDGPEWFGLGDALAIIPPFTGHGMTMAMQGAGWVVPELVGYARGEQDWMTAVARGKSALRRGFGRRLGWAGVTHRVLLHRAGQTAVRGLARSRLLPFSMLYRLTH